MLDWIGWVLAGLVLAVRDAAYAVAHPGLWLDWSNGEAVMRVVYYGGSSEFFFAVLAVVLVLTTLGLWRTSFMWRMVRGLEGFANVVGRIAAWAGLLMVLQQVIVVFAQRVFASGQLGLGPVSASMSWWSEELKLYNAMIVALCCAYTYVQGGHVRVDLVYARLPFRGKRVIDLLGSLLFTLPLAVLLWMYAWYFLWRHLITPKVSASEGLEQMLMKARAFRWNVETVAFSADGFNAYFLFKVLLVIFAGMIFLQGLAVVYRAFLELTEGPASEDRFLDRDRLEAGEVEMAGPERHAG